jgi:uncharacterized protein
MRFRKGARLDASQVEDYRGRSRSVGAPMAIGGGGLLTLVILIAVLLLGGNPLGGTGGGLDGLAGESAGTPNGDLADRCQSGADANESEDCRIVAVVNSVQAYWADAYRGYRPAETRFFSGSTSTGCGSATSAVGPFYCPTDARVYIDLGFFDDLQQKLGARGGPLAEAYVLAHEYGHHIQNLEGTLRSSGQGTGPQGGQVRIELQADCYAGLWVQNALRTGLVEEISRADVADALDAAAAVGDDRIQERTQGQTTPETWTHGSAEQRQSWFVRGIQGTGPQSCDTFGGGRV